MIGRLLKLKQIASSCLLAMTICLDESQWLNFIIERYEQDVLMLFPIRSTKDVVVFLKSLMNHKNVKINDLAKVLQISESDISVIMLYKKPFTFEYAERLKKAFDVDAPFVLQTA